MTYKCELHISNDKYPQSIPDYYKCKDKFTIFNNFLTNYFNNLAYVDNVNIWVMAAGKYFIIIELINEKVGNLKKSNMIRRAINRPIYHIKLNIELYNKHKCFKSQGKNLYYDLNEINKRWDKLYHEIIKKMKNPPNSDIDLTYLFIES